jgi:hypothetical protein
MGTKKKLDNIIWHIETNREVLSDERTLDDALKSLKNWSKELTNESVLKVEKPKTYKGWEILKMIDEGDLKEGDKYINNNDREFIVGAWLEPTVKAFTTNTFTIKEKEYMSFEEAIKTGKKFKHKDWDGYYNFIESIKKVSWKSDTHIDQMLEEKVWEVED